MPKVAKPRKHGKGRQINWIDASGTRRYRTYTHHREATLALASHQTEAAEGRASHAPLQTGRTFNELGDLWLRPNSRRYT